MKGEKTLSGSQIYKRLLRYAWPYLGAILLGMLGTVIASSTDAGFAYILKPLLDKGFIAKDPTFIRWLPVGIFVAFLIKGGAGFMSDYFMAWAGRNVVMRFRQDIFAHLLRLPSRFFDHATTGQLLSTLIYNVEQIAKASTDALVTLVRESCLVVGLLIVMMLTSWRLTLLFLITTPMIAIIARYSSLRMRRLSKNLQESMGQITHVAEEAIVGYKIVRIFGGEDYEKNKFNQITSHNRARELKVIITNSMASASVQQIASVVIAIMLYLATAHSSEITAGGFTSMIASMLAMLKPMRNLTTVNSTIQKGIAAAESLFKLLDEPVEKNTGKYRVKRVEGRIEYRDMSFAYEQGKPVLENINFLVEPGKTIALVGRSGSGKSTIVNLLPRFYDGFSGEIKIDGMDIRDIHLPELREQFALVSQNVTLFNDTIANNIAYGQFDVSRDEIIKAAEAAHAMEFIDALPKGLDSIVGENGVLLSGGQRQRIAIARALLKNSPILILDEATSALDTESERHIQAALEELMHTRTTLVIAHRLSTIENADIILVLDKGRIVEMGNHAQLLLNQQHYARLYHLQFKE
ncbi:MAG: lipid A export permease/ATP-binding protein MsbA [Gammaproteobacteria bacterium]|nr:lipid A export permease/ATP-binding protein MsbA [Gammaproteobacteria bacterium]